MRMSPEMDGDNGNLYPSSELAALIAEGLASITDFLALKDDEMDGRHRVREFKAAGPLEAREPALASWMHFKRHRNGQMLAARVSIPLARHPEAADPISHPGAYHARFSFMQPKSPQPRVVLDTFKTGNRTLTWWDIDNKTPRYSGRLRNGLPVDAYDVRHEVFGRDEMVDLTQTDLPAILEAIRNHLPPSP